MPRDILNPFTDVTDKPIEPGAYWGSDVLSNIKELHYGAGGKSYNVSDDGMWLGADEFASAPFRVDMAGNAIALSMTVGGYVVTGGAAADVNTGVVKITGVQIQDGTITAAKINVTSLSALSANLGTMTAGSISGVDITIGSGNNVFKANTQGIFLGNANVASAPFYVNMAGTLRASNAIIDGSIVCRGGSDWQGNAINGDLYVRNINANYIVSGTIDASIINVTNLNASNITAGSINAASINVANLNANNIVSGNYSIGQTGKPGSLIIARTSSASAGSNARLVFEGGSRIWSDSNNQIGINSLGSPMYIYVNSGEKIIIPDSGQTTMNGGANIKGNFNVSDGWVTRLSGDVKLDRDFIQFSAGGGQQSFALRDMGLTSYKSGANRAGLFWGNGARFEVDPGGAWFHVNGNDKQAIMKTSDGYRSLYCMESPEVWFMDFCSGILTSPWWMFWEKSYRYIVDPIFKEVTVAPYRYVPTTEKGIFQVWGKRRGHDYKRFEKKTLKDYRQNEKFLQMSKLN